MGRTKASLFTEKQNRLAAVFKALAHPARLAILQELLKSEHCICGDLVMETGLAQATVSQHLKEMKEAGLIKGSIDGVKVCYCIDRKNWEKLKLEMEGLFNQSLTLQENCC